MDKLDYDIIIFDMDGTLIDSVRGIVNCVQYSALKMGREQFDFEKLKFIPGTVLKESLSELYGYNSDEVDKAAEIWRERYRKKGMYEMEVYKGIHEMLVGLKKKGKIICTATCKIQDFAFKILESEKLDQYFDYIGGVDFEYTRVNKSDVISHVLNEIGCKDKSRAILIGDRKYDVSGAKETGIDCLGVLYGYGDKEELELAGADYLVESVEEILELF